MDVDLVPIRFTPNTKIGLGFPTHPDTHCAVMPIRVAAAEKPRFRRDGRLAEAWIYHERRWRRTVSATGHSLYGEGLVEYLDSLRTTRRGRWSETIPLTLAR